MMVGKLSPIVFAALAIANEQTPLGRGDPQGNGSRTGTRQH